MRETGSQETAGRTIAVPRTVTHHPGHSSACRATSKAAFGLPRRLALRLSMANRVASVSTASGLTGSAARLLIFAAAPFFSR